ncbi:retinoic acid receptor RXR-gamma-like [Branchiostoma lanceolatum]|uniref:retinoic acid receptor RXR-gamma-like n=1 Tax=Branchiostoma lanceolatum TaxID=7740 RepID=UPI0034543703
MTEHRAHVDSAQNHQPYDKVSTVESLVSKGINPILGEHIFLGRSLLCPPKPTFKTPKLPLRVHWKMFSKSGEHSGTKVPWLNASNDARSHAGIAANGQDGEAERRGEKRKDDWDGPSTLMQRDRDYLPPTPPPKKDKRWKGSSPATSDCSLSTPHSPATPHCSPMSYLDFNLDSPICSPRTPMSLGDWSSPLSPKSNYGPLSPLPKHGGQRRTRSPPENALDLSWKDIRSSSNGEAKPLEARQHVSKGKNLNGLLTSPPFLMEPTQRDVPNHQPPSPAGRQSLPDKDLMLKGSPRLLHPGHHPMATMGINMPPPQRSRQKSPVRSPSGANQKIPNYSYPSMVPMATGSMATGSMFGGMMPATSHPSMFLSPSSPMFLPSPCSPMSLPEEPVAVAGPSQSPRSPAVKNEESPSSFLDTSQPDSTSSDSVGEDSSSQPTSSTTADGDSPVGKPCPVCGDKISGFHYGIFSCESCKGFFKRTIQNKKNYKCLAAAKCDVSLKTRKRCPACRFSKCLSKGMKLEAIREDRTRGGRSTYEGALHTAKLKNNGYGEAKRRRHSMAGQLNFAPFQPLTPSAANGFARNQPLVKVKQEPLSDYPQEKTIPPLLQEFLTLESLMDEMQQMQLFEMDFARLCQMTEIQLRKMVKWACRMPLFSQVESEDQVLLLQSAWGNLLLLSACFHSLPHTSALYGTEEGKKKAESLGLDAFITRMIDQVEHLRRLKVDHNEYVALKALILLNPDVKGIKNRNLLLDYQDQVQVALQTYTESHYPEDPNKTGELLLRLTEIERACFIGKDHLVFRYITGQLPTCQLLTELLGVESTNKDTGQGSSLSTELSAAGLNE